MGLAVKLISESGEVLEEIYEPPGFFTLLPDCSDESSQCLRFIDPYGLTFFNTLQMPRFLRELALVESKTNTETMHLFIADLKRIAEQCRDRSRLYLRFMGD